MSTIDFYLVKEPSLESCYSFVCKLVDKAYQQKFSVYVHANSVEEANILDDLIWIFRDDAFIPHNLVGAGSENIQIGYKQQPSDITDILINLTAEIPEFANQFQRVLEIVPQNQKQKSREKYRMYRDQNCEINTHDLTKSN